VARSLITACTTLGARVTLVGPPTLLPLDVTGWPVTTSGSLDEVLADLDVVYMLRVQAERGGSSGFPSLPEYVARYGMDRARFDRLRPEAVVLHPGPINRGVELAPDIADDQRSLILPQVANGVAVRMAVLFRLLGDGSG
jgi:aspartate carbamoyltransferase catalytic subunit